MSSSPSRIKGLEAENKVLKELSAVQLERDMLKAEVVRLKEELRTLGTEA